MELGVPLAGSVAVAIQMVGLGAWLLGLSIGPIKTEEIIKAVTSEMLWKRAVVGWEHVHFLQEKAVATNTATGD